MPRRPPSGPKEGSEYGYNPAADMQARINRLINTDIDEGSYRVLG